MDALAAGHDAAVQMIDTSVVRVHQHGAHMADNNHQDMGRSRGGLTTKDHAVVDTNGLPVYLALNRHGRFRDSNLFRQVFEAEVRACTGARLTGRADQDSSRL
jgi:hypothetical protein